MTGPGDDPSTEELRAVQARREEAERDLAAESEDEREERTHERRAERAAYLRDKLDEQADADRRASDPEAP